MQPVYSNGVSLHFNAIPEHIDVFVPPTHKLKTSLTVENGITYLRTLTNSHFHFLIMAQRDRCIACSEPDGTR